MKLIVSINELLTLYPSLNAAVSILIKGLIEKENTDNLTKWDKFQSKDWKDTRKKEK